MKTRTGKIILSAAALIFSIHICGSYDRHSVQKMSMAALQTAAPAKRRNGNGSK